METSSKLINALGRIHQALITVVALVNALAVFLMQSERLIPATPHLDRPLQLVAVLLTALHFFIGNKLFNVQVHRARTSQLSAIDKVILYRKASLLQWMLLVLSAVFSSVCFVLTANLAFVFLSGATLIFMAMQAPALSKMAILLRVEKEELNQ